MVLSSSIAKTVIATTQTTVQIVKGIRAWRRKRKVKVEHIKDLFGFVADADFSTGNVPPDDVDSLRLFKQWFYQYFKKERLVEERMQLPPVNMNKHLCSIGGPVDHPLTRYAMGYDKTGRYWTPILEFYFPLDEVERRQVYVLENTKVCDGRHLLGI